MRRVSRLANRYRVFYLRCPIPRGLIPIFGCREISRSLKTTDRVKAVERLLAISLRIDRFFSEISKMTPIFQALPDEVRTALRRQIIHTIDTWPWISVTHEEERDAYIDHFTQFVFEIEDKQHNQKECLREGARSRYIPKARSSSRF